MTDSTRPPSLPPDIAQVRSGDSAEDSAEDPDEVWERNYGRIDSGKDDELKAMFRHLPGSKHRVELTHGIISGYIDADDYYSEGNVNKQELPLYHDVKNGHIQLGQYGKGYNGPFVLAKNVPLEKFEKWMECEWRLNKSVRLDTGTVYVPQACNEDHALLFNVMADRHFCPILSTRLPTGYAVKITGGSKGDMIPDMAWKARNAQTPFLVAEVGLSQSLPNLRLKTYKYCDALASYPDLQFVVLIKRYDNSLYVEIWQRNRGAVVQLPDPDAFFGGNQESPQNLVPGNCCMRFVSNCFDYRPGVPRRGRRRWQTGLNTVCNIPAGQNFGPGINGAPAIRFDANVFMNDLEWD